MLAQDLVQIPKTSNPKKIDILLPNALQEAKKAVIPLSALDRTGIQAEKSPRELHKNWWARFLVLWTNILGSVVKMKLNIRRICEEKKNS